MNAMTFNVLTEPLLRVAPQEMLNLPTLLARLAQNEVEGYPSLRPHQAPAWHMFLVQLAALALHRGNKMEAPKEAGAWLDLLRGLTANDADDAPWCLAVEGPNKPAFLQPPVPQNLKWTATVSTPDALDLLITSRNHDLKQEVAQNAQAEDWIFALVSLQTGEGFGGRDNYGIARMNGGSSSRPMLGLAPLSSARQGDMRPRPGAHFLRDVETLLATRAAQLSDHGQFGYPDTGGVGLVWLHPWPENHQLQLNELDIWFIEICRRIRLSVRDGVLSGRRGASKKARIAAKNFNGAIGDPWSPTHRTQNKGLTLGGGDFHYRKVVELWFSGDWTVPLLARPGPKDAPVETLALIAQALSRGNGKTAGFKSRIIPIGGHVCRALGAARHAQVHELAKEQIDTIGTFDKALRNALALAAAGGERDNIKKEHYAHTSDARACFDHAADTLFFPHLWARFEAEEKGGDTIVEEKRRFARALHENARRLFDAALPSIPCATIRRARAEARARSAFLNALNKIPHVKEEKTHAAA